jgi:hypothetical protein
MSLLGFEPRFEAPQAPVISELNYRDTQKQKRQIIYKIYGG